MMNLNLHSSTDDIMGLNISRYTFPVTGVFQFAKRLSLVTLFSMSFFSVAHAGDEEILGEWFGDAEQTSVNSFRCGNVLTFGPAIASKGCMGYPDKDRYPYGKVNPYIWFDFSSIDEDGNLQGEMRSKVGDSLVCLPGDLSYGCRAQATYVNGVLNVSYNAAIDPGFLTPFLSGLASNDLAILDKVTGYPALSEPYVFTGALHDGRIDGVTNLHGNGRSTHPFGCNPDVDETCLTGTNTTFFLTRAQLPASENYVLGKPEILIGEHTQSIAENFKDRGSLTGIFHGYVNDTWGLIKSQEPGESAVIRKIRGGFGPNLITKKSYQDFIFRFDVKMSPSDNSGIYIKGIWEINLHGSDGETPNAFDILGSIYGQTAPNVNIYHALYGGNNGQRWVQVEIKLLGRYVTVRARDADALGPFVDLQRNDAQGGVRLDGPTGAGVFGQDVNQPGPILIQAHPAGNGLEFRNMVITPIIPIED